MYRHILTTAGFRFVNTPRRGRSAYSRLAEVCLLEKNVDHIGHLVRPPEGGEVGNEKEFALRVLFLSWLRLSIKRSRYWIRWGTALTPLTDFVDDTFTWEPRRVVGCFYNLSHATKVRLSG